jgi:hypothetical protein
MSTLDDERRSEWNQLAILLRPHPHLERCEFSNCRLEKEPILVLHSREDSWGILGNHDHIFDSDATTATNVGYPNERFDREHHVRLKLEDAGPREHLANVGGFIRPDPNAMTYEEAE